MLFHNVSIDCVAHVDGRVRLTSAEIARRLRPTGWVRGGCGGMGRRAAGATSLPQGGLMRSMSARRVPFLGVIGLALAGPVGATPLGAGGGVPSGIAVAEGHNPWD
jgi:hypothetical protein